MARIVVEHPETGLRIAVEEEDFDNPEAHPQNHDHLDIAMDPNNTDTGAMVSEHAGRKGDERRSLKEDGYIPVAYQDSRSRETPLPKNYKPK